VTPLATIVHLARRRSPWIAASVAACAAALAGGWVGIAAVALAAAPLLLHARARRATTAGGCDLEKLATVALAPGVTVHAVRFRATVFVLAATQSGIAVLETTSDAAPRRPRVRAPGIAGVVRAVVAVLAIGLPVSAAQQESVEQRAPLDAEPAPLVQPRAPGADAAAGVPATDESPGAAPVVWLGALALAPFALMALTSFVKTTIVLSLLRSGLGTPQVPPDPVLAGIALALTWFVMAPVADDVVRRVRSSGADVATASGAVAAIAVGAEPLRAFLLRNTRPDEIALFVELSTRGGRAAARPDAFEVLAPAFVTSELRRAFIAGFFVLVPFLVVDLVVSNILMSMGMVMVSPATVALPFKVMLFVLVDGWPMLLKGLALSYH
jgi:type III secretion apparatus YscR/HrcR family protein